LLKKGFFMVMSGAGRCWLEEFWDQSEGAEKATPFHSVHISVE
jgi:hypothetical protein